jgi:uncharacterized caspase-like protein
MNAFIRAGARVACAFAFLAVAASGALADRRVALVIGNANYEHADKLGNTLNDADTMTQLFKRAGFDVVDERRDVGVVEFKRAVRDFLTSASNADIAVVYYSGHGLEVSGTNYLIPVDAKLSSAFDVDDEAVPLDRVLLATASAKKLSLIILDACRENPFLRAEGRLPATRAIASRLIGVEPTNTDTLVAYAAKAGSVSYDGAGTNSPFTTALIKYITQPGLDIRIALGKVRDDVLEATGHRQEPFVYGSLGGADISLVPAPRAPAAATIASDAVVDYQLAERLGTAEGWRVFLSAHKSGYYAELAHAQLARLTEFAAAEASNQATPVRSEPPRVTAAVAPSQPAAQAEKNDEVCRREAGELARLRADPAADQVAQFSRRLECADLRPQVQRLMESLGIAASAQVAGDRTALPQPSSAAAATESKSSQKSATADGPPSGDSCKTEADQLSRIRANPDRDTAKRFAQQLKCDRLKAQAARLLESLGD